MKILIIGDSSSLFIVDYIKNLKNIKKKYNIDIATLNEGERFNEYYRQNNINIFSTPPTRLKKIFNLSLIKNIINSYYLKRIFRELPKYDIVHIHYLEPLLGLFAKEIIKCGKKIIISIWGSDFYRAHWMKRLFQKKLIDAAERIIFGHEMQKKDFIDFWGLSVSSKSVIARYGSDICNKFSMILNESREDCKKAFQVPPNDIVAVCGYNGRPQQQHIKIIDSLKRIKTQLPENILFIFPMANGATHKYKHKIIEYLELSGLRYMVIDNFLESIDMARFRKASDIMINVQTTDAFSASVRENIYSGNIIINGEWLPYEILNLLGIFTIQIKVVEEIGNALLSVLDNFNVYMEKSSSNSDKIYDYICWEKNINNWINIYNEVLS